MLIYPHTGRSDIGKTVVPGVGSFLGTGGLGSVGLFLDHVGSYVPICLVKLSEIQREVEEILGNSELDGSAVPVGFRDADEVPASTDGAGGLVVDLKNWPAVMEILRREVMSVATCGSTPCGDLKRLQARRPRPQGVLHRHG